MIMVENMDVGLGMLQMVLQILNMMCQESML